MSRHAVAVRRSLAAVVVAILGLGPIACGDGTTSPSPPDTVTTTLPIQPFHLASGEVAFTDVTVNGTGVLTSTADWTFATSDLDVYVTTTSCTARTVFALESCSAAGRTTAILTKPERLTVNVLRGNYRVWVANYSLTAESGTLAITATVAR
jgi:hypothetical protein